MADTKKHRNLRVGPVWDRCVVKAHDVDGVPLAELVRVFLDAYDADDPVVAPLVARLRAETRRADGAGQRQQVHGA